MFRHVVLINWKPEASTEQRAAVLAGLRALPAQIPQLRQYRVGEDAGVDAGNADFAVVADFDNADGYRVYRDHPSHLRVLQTLVLPILDSRSAVQYETD